MKHILILCLLLFTACAPQNVSQTDTTAAQSFMPYVINVKYNRTRAKGEKEKCMKGVSLYNEFSFEGINDFEKKTDTDNDVYIKSLSYNDEFPGSFVIECISKGKTPMLILNSNVNNIEDIAKKCGSIASEIFISFDYGLSTELYNRSAAIFRKYAPNTVLMWNIAYDEAVTAFPKEEYVDWVNLTFNENILYGKIDTKVSELRNSVKYFSDKAVALNISVENFSSENHKYYTDLWKNEIYSIYNMAGDYENIALVSYVQSSESNRVYGSSRLSESRLVWQGYGMAAKLLPDKREWSSTDMIAYVNNNTAYIDYSDARLLNIEARYVNNSYAAIKNYSLDNSNRKMFVYLDKM